MTFSLTIAGTPKAWKAPTTTRFGRGYHPNKTASDQEYHRWRENVILTARHNRAPDMPWTGPLSLSLVVYLERPKGHFGAKGLKPRYANAMPFDGRKDLSNLVKCVEDCLQQAGVFVNDVQITDYVPPFAKRYADGRLPGCDIVIERIGT